MLNDSINCIKTQGKQLEDYFIIMADIELLYTGIISRPLFLMDYTTTFTKISKSASSDCF